MFTSLSSNELRCLKLGVKQAEELFRKHFPHAASVSSDTTEAMFSSMRRSRKSKSVMSRLKSALASSFSLFPSRADIDSEEEKQAELEATTENDHYNGKVHQGIWNSYLSLRLQLLQKVVEAATLFALQGHPLIRVLLTGHSLGGAMATLAAYDISRCLHRIFATHPGSRWAFKYQVQLYSFGSPRVLDKSFHTKFCKEVPCAFRMVYDRDFITDSPPPLSSGLRHVGKEVLLDGEGNIMLNASWLEKLMLENRNSLDDHKLSSYTNGLEKIIEYSKERLRRERED
eukprot:gb/GEZN01014213.1/.p1 GENE.gb/GEZN01014213.1/~~gb/GEZN01014213.1/.p1  ORF type:complete len:295 (-),score=39.90 gb/GEZN01014213.1/:81-938(-)